MARNTDKVAVEVKKMTEQEAVAEIANLTEAAYEAIRKAEALADEYGVDFSFSVSYGMGGSYISKKTPEWDEEGWVSSSQNC